jgi:hypothetical protein
MKYFLHDTSSFQDEKITELFIKFGYEGLGLFYTILEKIALQEKPIKTSVLKAQLKIGKRLEKCWNFMEEIDIIQSNNGETFNVRLLSYSEKYQIKKEKNAKRISEWREKQTVTENVTHSENVRNTPKVNRSKVKESKVKENTENAKILNEFSRPFFDSKYINEKSLDMFDKLLLKYPIDKIQEAIKKAKSDSFWNTNFLSPVKLNSKDKSGVLYIDVFLNIKLYNQSQQAIPKKRMVHYKMFGHFYTHHEKAYNENLTSYGAENIEFLNYVEDGN